MFLNNDFSEQGKIHTAGVLPVRRPAEYYKELKSYDSAAHAMTDFTSKFAITVASDRQIDAALNDMLRLSVRSMLVVRDDSVIGLVTSYDIEGPRSVRFAERHDAARREDIKVGDIMTEWADLPTLAWQTESRWCVDSYLVRESSGSCTQASRTAQPPSTKMPA